ncbi:MAG: hypothetical protein KF862_07145 [Chitinophagaceae bacterium]|nr:hypothetical protein [Chitinophagaceae bacterium]
MTPPKITLRELKEKISGFSFPESVYMVGIRGYYLNSMGKEGENDRGIYDDAIILVAPNLYQTYNANTDPSKYRKGIATLVPGLHYYRKGKHGITKPGGGYPALRPDNIREELPVARDGQEGIFKGIAINIHKGGYTTTSSEGCQTVYPSQWDAFITNVYKAMDREGQRRIPYILIENK